ncbi:hypothetical protein ABN057_08895 [Providencia alcalifaciens]|uniref:hypothetical protein n=1 Tax=Providencia TaxID=586 RepID=UPI00197FB557|nr:hypothetical protein [Providencia rettgeri]MBN6351736.1 hypothetical protein [Providencia rettgeri]
MFNKITYPVSELNTTDITPKNRLKSLFSKKVKLISNSSINLHPKGVGKGYETCKAFSLEKSTRSDIYFKIGYISDFKGMKEEALTIHGTPNGQVSMYSNNTANRKYLTVKEAISHIKSVHNVDLTVSQKPLHVLSCFGVTNGVYQSFANKLNREVIGYGDGGVLRGNDTSEYLSNPNVDPLLSVIDHNTPQEKTMIASVHKYYPAHAKNSIWLK